MNFFSDKTKLESARKLFKDIGGLIDSRFSIRLWDGSMVPLGSKVDTDYFISINGPGVLGSLFRKPTYENLLLQYAKGNIGVHGDIIDFIDVAREKRPKKKLKKINKFRLIAKALPFIFTSSGDVKVQHEYASDEIGDPRAAAFRAW